jgi:hypothetical protein
MGLYPIKEVRLSEVARGCDRMSVLRALGAEAATPGPEAEEYFARGIIFEAYILRGIILEHGRENVERQVTITHPLGEGHADAYVRTTQTLVEVKSSTGNDVVEVGVAQLKLYIRYHPEATRGLLIVVNPSTLQPAERILVGLTDAEALEIDRQINEIGRHIEVASLPDRVCRIPSEARKRFCRFAAQCFMGWEPPDPFEIEDPEDRAAAADAIQSIVGLALEEKTTKAYLERLQATRREQQEILSALVPVGEAVINGHFVRRTEVKGRRSFDFKAYEAAGAHSSVVEEFTKHGDPHDRWTVRPLDDDTYDDD